MYLNRYAPCSGESFPNDDAVNKMLHHLPGQMLYMDITENTLPLLVYTLNAYNAPYQLFLIQIAQGKAVQLLNDKPFQCIHRNKGAGAGIPRRASAGTL